MAITIDCREPLDVIEAVQDTFGEENVRIARLPTADFVMVDECRHVVGIERKTVADLLGSFASGRLHKQLTRLVQGFDVPILLIEGHYGLDSEHRLKIGQRGTGWNHGAVQMALFSLQSSGIFVLQTPNLAGLVNTLDVLYRRGQPPNPKCLVRYDTTGVPGDHLPERLAPTVGEQSPRVQQRSRVVLAQERPYSPARGDSLGEKPPAFTLAGPKVSGNRSRTGRLLKERAIQRDRDRSDARDQPHDGVLLDGGQAADSRECKGVA